MNMYEKKQGLEAIATSSKNATSNKGFFKNATSNKGFLKDKFVLALVLCI